VSPVPWVGIASGYDPPMNPQGIVGWPTVVLALVILIAWPLQLLLVGLVLLQFASKAEVGATLLEIARRPWTLLDPLRRRLSRVVDQASATAQPGSQFAGSGPPPAPPPLPPSAPRHRRRRRARRRKQVAPEPRFGVVTDAQPAHEAVAESRLDEKADRNVSDMGERQGLVS